MTSYVSARGRASALVVLVIVQLALLGIASAGWVAGRLTLDGSPTAAIGFFGLAGVAQIVDLFVFIAATVVFLTWVHRSIANLSALNELSCRWSPSEAVWSFFIPFVNLVRGHQIVAAIWSESQPITDEASYLAARSTALVSWWWGLYLLSGVAALFVSSGARTLDEVRATATGQALFGVLRIAVALLFLFIVRGAQRRQDEQWRDLELRRAVPQPTAEALR